jgi:hypothetical protein
MKWDEIHDSRGEIEILAPFLGNIREYFTPGEVQKLIDQHGVEAMAKMVNNRIPVDADYTHLFVYETESGGKNLAESRGMFGDAR